MEDSRCSCSSSGLGVTLLAGVILLGADVADVKEEVVGAKSETGDGYDRDLASLEAIRKKLDSLAINAGFSI